MSKKNKEAADVQSFNRISARANILLNIMFLILALICVIPAVLVVSISFSAEQSITDYGYRLIPKIISLDGYGYLLKQGADHQGVGSIPVCYYRGNRPGNASHHLDGIRVIQAGLQAERISHHAGLHPHGI